MHDVASKVQFDIHEISRLSQETLELLTATDDKASPIRYREVLERTLQIRVIWDSHTLMSAQIYAFLRDKDPRLERCLTQLGIEQQRLMQELKFLTPVRWPRSTHFGLNSLRIRAFHTLPLLLQAVKREEATVFPIIQRWVYGGAATHASIAERETSNMTRRSASA